MRHRVRGHGVGWIEIKGALRQAQRVINRASFVMGPGILGQKGPIIFALGGTAMQQLQKLRWEIGLPDAATAPVVQQVRQPHQERITGKLNQMVFELS